MLKACLVVWLCIRLQLLYYVERLSLLLTGDRKGALKQQEGHSQSQLQLKTSVSTTTTTQDSSEHTQCSETPPTFTSEVTSAAEMDNGRVLHEAFEEVARAPPTRRVAGGNDGESELEISQRTWSAYESLPRGLTRFREGAEFREEGPAHLLTSPDDIGIDNDAYCSSQELLSLRRPQEPPATGHTPQLRLLPAPHGRFSTVSTASSGSGYVISSLHSPAAPHSPRERDRTSCYSPAAPHSPRERDRTSCYSTGSDGYVINSLEWANGRVVAPLKPVLPRIAENSLPSEYLQILPSL